MEPGDEEYQHLFQIFSEECREHIQKLNEGLLVLERQPKEAPLDDILRAAHSLKGASRMMGLKTIETLAHYLESLLTQLIRGERQVTPTVVQGLYRGVDALSHVLTSLEAGKEPESIEQLMEQLQTAAGEKALSQPPPESPPPDKKEQSLSPLGMGRLPSGREEVTALATIRVQTERLDTLINQTGELLVTKIEALDNLRQIEETLDRLEEGRKKLERHIQPGALLNTMDELNEGLGQILKGVSENTRRLETLVDAIHEGLRDLRLLPISTILNQFPRMVRDLSHDLGKEVELVMEGASIRLDKKILEELRDPLIHLVRNSIDHGIEGPEERERKGKPRQGRLLIATRQENKRVFIAVKDDGKGLDRQAIERAAVQRGLASAEEVERWNDEEVWDLVFRTGFSTAPGVSEISGRGIGLDVVLSKLERLKGSIAAESRAGEGATFTLSLPLTLGTTHALLFRAGGDTFCLPTASLEKTLLLFPDEITSVEGKTTAVIQGAPLAFAWLADILNLPKAENRNGAIPALLLESPRGKAVFGVESLLGEEEIVLKPLGKFLDFLPLFSGGTILGKGEIALILNPNDLIRSLSSQLRAQPSPVPLSKPSLPPAKKRVLVVEDSLTTRTLERNILEAAGFEVTTAVDGEDALIKLHEKIFDIVVTDIQMPRLDGLALTQRMKKDERFRDVPVILVTALQTDADKRRGIEVGADAYITKATFDQKLFLEIIQRFA